MLLLSVTLPFQAQAACLVAVAKIVTYGHHAKIWIFAMIMVFAFLGLRASVTLVGEDQRAA
jgi:hypothetical protein